MKNNYFIGLMSGTSADGIDAVLVDFSKKPFQLIDTHSVKFETDLRQRIYQMAHAGIDEIHRYGALDVELGTAFANAVNDLLQKNSLNASDIRAIGSHGQTVRHCPNHAKPFTLQIGDANIIAAHTGITTVADFRRRDVALGGQGAPLTPAFHYYLFNKRGVKRAIVNIGGIANITLLTHKVVGFDSGPGNVLLDAWAQYVLRQPHDKNGEFAQTGRVNTALLNRLLSDPYFFKPPPKSTGREYFNLSWLRAQLLPNISAQDVQATLTELTAASILNAAGNVDEFYICGGGVHNAFLMQRLQTLAGNTPVKSTDALGVDPDWLEAIAFAWFAKQTLNQKTSNLPQVTGAREKAILGAVYY